MTLPSPSIQFLRFAIVGTVGFAVDSGILCGCMRWLAMDPYSARAVSFLAAASTTWRLNRAFTFRGQGSALMHREWARFMLVSAAGFALNYSVYATLVATTAVVAADPVLGVAAGSATGLLFNFHASRRLVFRTT